MPTPPTGTSSQPPRASTRARRNYQACLACKEQKVRCHLGSPDDPQPPCARCRRSRLDCVFGPPRAAVRRPTRKRRGGADDSLDAGGDSLPNSVPSVGVHAPAAASDDSAAEPGHGRPADAASSSTATVPDQHPSPWDASAIEASLHSQHVSAWAQFALCRDGWISPREAEFLLQCYFDRMNPLYPVVDETYQHSSRRHGLLVDEPVLCTAILTVASRYAWLDGTPASSRAHEIHSFLFKQAQQAIHQSLWGIESIADRESRILSTIESIILFVEWRPRPMDIMPNQGTIAGATNMFGVDAADPGTTQNSVIDDETRKAYMLARRLNATSWRLLGHAVNLADEISLVEGLTRSREAQPRAPTHVRRRARIRDLLIPLTWEIAFRLGRSASLKLPMPSAPTADEYADEGVFSTLLNSRAELYRLCRLVENTLYSSVSATKDIITSDRHPEVVAALVDILTDWWNKFQRLSGPFAFRKTLEIQYYNVWTYLHAIFFQAILERLRGFTTGEPSIQNFERTYRPEGLSIAEVLRSERSRRDLHMTEEIAKASVQVLERVLDLEREGYLSFIPFTTMTWMFTSATLLLKGTGLRTAADLGTTSLLKRVSQSLDRAAVDDVHAMSHRTSSLMFLIQKVQAGPATSRNAGRPRNNIDDDDASKVRADAAPQAQPVPEAAANLPPMNTVDAGNRDATPGVLPGSGGLFDPMLADGLAEDWANWLSVGLDNMDGSFGFDLFSGSAAGEFPAPWQS
ncbi:c6 transcription factor [Diplodia corticola]|uniref:C6 transcription factor n=1 Tax=Diplodia corticola TaxID=236234 RepID=A0A1J9REQ5_9PEZI|nr:c6 transcription factor [Diplodia corticola]OJD38570.1 c6 transcription factor [Diplodia corticola]